MSEEKWENQTLKDVVDYWPVCLNLLSGISSIFLCAFWAEG